MKSQYSTEFPELEYLTEVSGSEALSFARSHNEISNNRLKSDPRFKITESEILKILTAKDKLPSLQFINSEVYNFWQDEVHTRGILRKTTIESFNSGSPAWTLVLDIDLLAKKENKNWVYKGFICLEPNNELCIISLSDGGKDANTKREFNLKTKAFVENGFFIPESKTFVDWINKDTLIVADGTDSTRLTTSGYPTEVKLLSRGQDLKNSKIVFATSKNSVSASGSIIFHESKNFVFVYDSKSFYKQTVYLYDLISQKLKPLPIPETAYFQGLFKDQVLFTIREDLGKFKAGTLLSFLISDIEQKNPKFEIVFESKPTSIFQSVFMTKDFLIVEVLSDAKQSLLKLQNINSGWKSENLNFGGVNGTQSVASTEKTSNSVFFGYTDFLTPSSLYYRNLDKDFDAKLVQQLKPQFKSKELKVEQFKVKSKDGTLIPYFLISKKQIQLNSKNPTLLYGYGGFEVSLTPSYSGAIGKAWLENGGIYVLSNIRGGGEFGPEWHRSVLKENRHLAYEDFYAIAEDLIAKKITSPKHLGIKGGSNGGLLTSVAFTQRPELFNAVISEVPLANMLEYHKWLAGASWMEEYGDPDEPKMREYLKSYSPLHNLKKEAKYPEVFYLTSTQDDRVHPAHARQMVARLEQLGHAVLYNENTNGGHGRATNPTDMAEFMALEFTYLFQKLL